MFQSTDYAILFLDGDQEHSPRLAHEAGIQFFRTAVDLTTYLGQHQDIHYAVCVCCRNQETVGNFLQLINNVMSVSLYLDHNQEARLQGRHFLQGPPHQWQIDLHRQALNVNAVANPRDVCALIQAFIERIICASLHAPHSPTE